MQIASLFAAIGADTSKFDKALRSVDSQLDKHAKTFGGWQGAITKGMAAVGLAAAGAAAGIGAAMASGTKKAIEFETAFTGVIKTVDATDKELAGLRKGILDMSGVLPSSASSIANVAEAAGQLGIKTDNVLGFTRVMSDLGVTTNMSSTDAATALARFANITGMAQTDFDRLGSSVVALGNNLATTEGEIVTMGLRIAGAGSQIGLSESQILAWAGSLSSVGIEAEAGGSAISRVMVDIASEVATGGDKLEQFAKLAGMSAGDFSKAFKEDASQAIIAFLRGLNRMSTAGENVFGTLEELGMDDIRVRDTLLRASNAVDLFNDSLQLSGKAWEENNALTKEAELRYGTTASKFQIFRNVVDTVRIGVGDKLLPALGGLLDWSTELVKQHGPMVVEWFGGLIDFSVAFGRGIADWFMPAIKGVFSFLGNIPNAYRKFREIVDNVSDPGLVRMVNGLRSSFQGLGKILGNLARPFKDAFGGLFQSLMVARGGGWANVFDVLISRLWGAVSRFGEVMRTEAVPFILAKLGELGTAIKSWLGEIDWWDKIKGWASAFAGWAANIWDDGQGGGVKVWLGKFWGWLTGWVTDPEKRSQLWSGITSTWNFITEWAGAIWGWAEPYLTSTWNWLTAWVVDENKRSQLWEGVKSVWTGIWDWAAAIWNGPNGNDGIGYYLGEAWGWLSGWVTDENKRTQLLNGLMTVWTGFWDWAGRIWNNGEGGGIGPALGQAWGWLTSWVTDEKRRSDLMGGLKKVWTGFADWAGKVWDDGSGGGIGPKLNEAWNWLIGWVVDPEKRGQLWSGIVGAWTGFGEWAQTLWLGTSDSPGVKSHLDQFMVDLKSWITENTPNLGEWLDSFTGLIDGILDGWNSGLPQLEQRWKEFTDNVLGPLNSVKETFESVFGSEEEGGALYNLGVFVGKAGSILVDLFGTVLESLITKIAAMGNSLMYVVAAFSAAATGDMAGAWENLSKIGGEISRFGSAWGKYGEWWQRSSETWNGPVAAPGGGGGGFGDSPAPTQPAARQPDWSAPYDGVTAERDGVMWVWRNGRWNHPDSRARGGRSTFGGMTWVGEKGPELVNLPSGSYVHTAAQSAAMASRGGSQRIDLYVHGDSNLPQDRGKLRELAIALQRELQLSGATTTRLALA